MSILKIVATLVAKEEANEAVFAAVKELVDATRQESGCIYYALHRDTKTPTKYVILETWESQAAIDLHNATPHFQAFGKFADGKLDHLDISVVEELY